MKVAERYGKVVFPTNEDPFDALAIIEQKSVSGSIKEEAAHI